MSKNAVIVILTDRKVDVITTDHVLEEMADLLYVLPFGLVDPRVVIILSVCLRSETVPELHQLHSVLCSLFKHNQSINIPSIESDSITPIHDQFSEEFESHEDNLIVLMKRIQCAFNDRSEVPRIEPVKEDIKGLLIGASLADASEDIKESHDILPGTLCRLQCLTVH